MPLKSIIRKLKARKPNKIMPTQARINKKLLRPVFTFRTDSSRKRSIIENYTPCIMNFGILSQNKNTRNLFNFITLSLFYHEILSYGTPLFQILKNLSDTYGKSPEKILPSPGSSCPVQILFRSIIPHSGFGLCFDFHSYRSA